MTGSAFSAVDVAVGRIEDEIEEGKEVWRKPLLAIAPRRTLADFTFLLLAAARSNILVP